MGRTIRPRCREDCRSRANFHFGRNFRGFRQPTPDFLRENFRYLGKFPASQEYSRGWDLNETLLFVYGTLRPGCDDPMARWLRNAARHVGPAIAQGLLYRVGTYPGFVPDGSGVVTGDLFALSDPEPVLAVLDDYEECAAHFPPPHEYRRERLTVRCEHGQVEAWTYIYMPDSRGLKRIKSGDFLARE